MKNSKVGVNEFIFSKISKYTTDALMCGIVIAGENATLIIEDSYTMPEGGVSPPQIFFQLYNVAFIYILYLF